MFAQTLLLFYSEYTWPKLRPGIADGCFLKSPPPPRRRDMYLTDGHDTFLPDPLQFTA
jgi:hypothetical protein